MSYTISTLLTRNLHDVFGEKDPARRRVAIDELFIEDCVFYDPGVQWVSGRPGDAPVYAGSDFIIAQDGRIAALYVFFDKLP